MSSRSNVLTNQLRQTAVWWANPVNDGFGNRTFDAGVEISCRWEDRQELFTDAEGRQIPSRAVVYVDRDVAVHDYLFLGELGDLDSNAEQPFDADQAFEIRAFQKSPSLTDATRFVRKVWL